LIDMTKAELIRLVEEIQDPGNKTDKEIDALVETLERNVPHPDVSDLIFYDNLGPEEIVDKALAYKPIQL